MSKTETCIARKYVGYRENKANTSRYKLVNLACGNNTANIEELFNNPANREAGASAIKLFVLRTVHQPCSESLHAPPLLQMKM